MTSLPGIAPNSCSWKLLVRFSLLEFCECLLEIRQDQILRACVGHEVQDMEFVSCDDRVVSLTHLADLLDDLADFVVLLDCLSDGLVRNIYTQLVMHDIKKPYFELSLHVIE